MTKRRGRPRIPDGERPVYVVVRLPLDPNDPTHREILDRLNRTPRGEKGRAVLRMMLEGLGSGGAAAVDDGDDVADVLLAMLEEVDDDDGG